MYWICLKLLCFRHAEWFCGNVLALKMLRVWCAFWIKKLMRKITELLIISEGVMPSLLRWCEQDYMIVMSSNHTSILSMWPLEYSAKIQAISLLGRPGNTRKRAIGHNGIDCETRRSLSSLRVNSITCCKWNTIQHAVTTKRVKS